MSRKYTTALSILALCLALAIPACDDSPQSPQQASSISGSVVFEQTGGPAAGVDVVLETSRMGMMMMGDDWYQAQHMGTDSHGEFHFEYMHDSTHRYRVSVPGMSDPHTCYGGVEDGVVLRIPAQFP